MVCMESQRKMLFGSKETIYVIEMNDLMIEDKWWIMKDMDGSLRQKK